MPFRRPIHRFSRLDIYIFMAYYGVKERAAWNYFKRFKEDYPKRKRGVFFVVDLARYEGYETDEEIDEFIAILMHQRQIA